LQQLLHGVRRRWATLVWLQVWARVLGTVALIVAMAVVTDRWLSPDGAPLLLLAIVTAIASLASAVALIQPHLRRPDDVRVARYVEERVPSLDDAVVTAADLERGGGRDGFADVVIERGVSRLRDLDLLEVVTPEAMNRARIHSLGAAAALLGVLLLALPFGGHVLEVARLRFFPGTIAISVQPGDVRIAAGRPLRIVARLDGHAGALTHVTPTLALESNGQVRTVEMQPAADGYAVTINRVDRSFGYRVRAGRAASHPYAVTALFPPHVKRIDLRYEYPAFTRLPAREEGNAGDVFGPAGTRVRLRIATDKPIVKGHLNLGGDKAAVNLTRVDDRTLESTLTVEEDGSYRVALADADGLTSEGMEYFIRLMDDRPAEVHVLRPVGDQGITPLEEVTIEARADDDYGVASFELVYAVAGGKEKVVPFTSVTGTNVARIGSRLLAAEDLGVKPGDVVTYYARARDVARGKPSTLSRSEIFFLEVKPFNEEYSMAQSQAMAAATGTELESLIAAQKEIISATWNIERRSAAGRSPADVKAIADAQVELKTRVEQSSSGQRPRRRGNPGPQQMAMQTEPARNPVADAIASMGRAAQQLGDNKTSDAIPHEMAALTALLKAEAEVKRREVMQSNGASNGGNGRQGQDLSNLFDRELKRQQRTNYETQSQIEEQPSGADAGSALDRIRELARRQEELTRQQRDLASSELSADEVKRELEKLLREQTELRKQADDLARQMERNAQQSAAGQETQKGMGRAADQMRGAASELGRDDAASAAARSEQAARELRNLENRMQSASPEARRRALGELQLDAQQAADAQRRIASEAQRLDGQAGGSGDARRRLAGEKETLADRVDALKDAARRLANDPKAAAADRAAVADALKEMDRQQVSDRMRASARQMRQDDANGDPSAAGRKRMGETEQQLAEALDQAAKRLNGADAGGAKGDMQRLADQLDQARGARDRLARLEKQIRDKEAEAAQASASRGGRPGSAGSEGARAGNTSQGEGSGNDLARLQQEYARAVEQSKELLGRLQRGTPDSGGNMSTPENHEWSRSAPGTEAWKQDYAKWEGLGKDVTQALERYESATAARLSRALTADRLRAGASERVPDAYQKRIAKYFESLAKH
jgi:hypothetical protein